MTFESVVRGVDRGREGMVGVGEAVARGVHEELSVGVELFCGEGRIVEGSGVGGKGRGQHCESDEIEDGLGPKAGMSVWESLRPGPEKGELGLKI